MERLTYSGENGIEIKGADGTPCDEVCENRLLAGCHDCPIQTAFERLAAYEDTRLEPEVCAEYKKFEDEAIGNGVTFKRIVELMQAEKDGRLVVLQDGVSARGLQEEYCMYKRIADEQLPSNDYTTGHIAGFSDGIAHILGKILTHEEADAALKKREEDDGKN